MVIPESLILLAGFVFAHAAWNLSDLPDGELLVPLAIIEESGQKKLLRFEGETQEEAIALGKAKLYQQTDSIDAWAFARDGQIEEDGKYVDVLTIEARARGMSDSIIFSQKYQPFSTGSFKLDGAPLVSIGGKLLSPSESEHYLSQLQPGIQSHSQAAALWLEWVKGSSIGK